MPKISAKDSAVWRRIDVIPFNVSIAEDERDPKIKEILRDPELAGAAILAWAVKGCRKWIESGLKTPDVVRATTQEYRLLMSELKPFIEDKCKIGPHEWESTKVLYDAYNDWCENRRLVPLDSRQFVQRLEEYGCSPKKRRVEGLKEAQRGWLGISLRFDSEMEDANDLFIDSEDEYGLQKYT
jgi:putative DNA primase/helicase